MEFSDGGLDASGSRSGQVTEEKHLLPLPGIDPGNLVTILPSLSLFPYKLYSR
jgi:hypothetical protein